MKTGEPHCMSQYFRTTLPFLSGPCPWVSLSPPPPPHAAAIRDRDARVAASVSRRRLVLAMVNSLEGALREVFAGRGPPGRCRPSEGWWKGWEQSSGASSLPAAVRRPWSGFPAVYQQDRGPATACAAGFLGVTRPIFGKPAPPPAGASAGRRERRVERGRGGLDLRQPADEREGVRGADRSVHPGVLPLDADRAVVADRVEHPEDRLPRDVTVPRRHEVPAAPGIGPRQVRGEPAVAAVELLHRLLAVDVV